MDILKKLAELDELRDLLVDKLQTEAGDTDAKIKALEAAQPMIKPGTPEHAALLATGYGMTVEKAQTIISERKKNPAIWPYEMLEKAEAMLAAYNAKPVVISTRKPWRTRPRRQTTTFSR